MRTGDPVPVTYEQATRPVLNGWSFAVSLAIPVPCRRDGYTRQAGGIWTYGPGLNAEYPVLACDLGAIGGIMLGQLDDIQRAAVGMPLRVRLATASPIEDGLLIADFGFSPSLAEAARLRVQHQRQADG
jgi:hypothetical protein